MKKIKKQIVVRAFTPIAKPANATVQKNSTMLLLGDVTYQNGSKDFNTKMYFLKGIRGMLRHACMRLAKSCGIEVCHTSEKTELKDGTSLVPDGFHPLGACDGMNPCILRSIFGTFRQESRIKVSAEPLARIKHKEYTPDVPVQNVHIASESRIALSYDGIPIQDFRESYFSGAFTFEIDVTKLSVDEVKFLMESILYIEHLGGGKNSGYGKVTVLDFEYQELEIERTAAKNGDGTFQITEEITSKHIDIEDIENWRQNYITEKEV